MVASAVGAVPEGGGGRTAPRHSRSGGIRRYDPGGDRRLSPLDGIRCFAVLAVILYHAGVPGLGGGLLGVDVFFVLSGFLITSLLCDEHRRRSTIALARFWGRRARRLLPALFILLVGVAAYAWWFRQSLDVASIRGDALATLGFVANWRFVFSHQGYFDLSTTPSPLLPMWSLGVEEQFYLVWPLVSLAVLHHWGTRGLARVAAAGAAASAVLAAALYAAGASINLLYYGTDTRAQALLAGAALGAVASTRDWHVLPPAWATGRRRRLVGLLGLAGAAVLAWCWHAATGQGPFLYAGGFLVVALATGAVITAVTTVRTSLLARCLSLRPLVYLGLISYGLYVYHWPIFLVVSPTHTPLTGTALLAVRLAVTLAVAVASYHLVELPVRRGTFLRGWRGLSFASTGAVAVAAVVVLATVPPVTAAPTVRAATGLPAAEHRQLEAAGAFGAHPVRFLMVGDSVALTAAAGLDKHSRRRYGVEVLDGGIEGCNLTAAATVTLQGQAWPGGPGSGCWQRTRIWRRGLTRFRPTVVGLLIGRFELATYLVGGQREHLGQAGWDRHLRALLQQAVQVLSSGGARVVLYTFPYIDPPLLQPDGDPWPTSLPSRVDAWNRIVRSVAAADRSRVTLVDLARMLDPGGHYTSYVDGIRVRWKDTNIHVTVAGGIWLQPKLLPEVAALGLADRRAR